MKAYCFKAQEGRCAILAMDDPASLPEEFGPWKRLGEMEIHPSDPDRLGMPTAICLDNLEAHGSHFFQLKMEWD